MIVVCATSPPFPYTTLFRSRDGSVWIAGRRGIAGAHRSLRGALRRIGLAAAARLAATDGLRLRSEEHTSELQSLRHIVCRLLLEKKNLRAQTSRTRDRKTKV